MTTRRNALIALGLASFTSGCSGIFGFRESADQLSDSTMDELLGTSSEFQQMMSQFKEYEQARKDPQPEIEFGYGNESIEETDYSMLSAIAASSPDSNGDTLVIQPAALTPDELAQVLREIWGVGAETTMRTTVAGTEVEFTGGPGPKYMYLVGAITTADESAVLVARGVDYDSAVSLAKDISLS